MRVSPITVFWWAWANVQTFTTTAWQTTPSTRRRRNILPTTTRLAASTPDQQQQKQQRPARSTAKLEEWATNVGIQKNPALQLTSDATTGLGWQLQGADVAADQVLLQVPTDVALTVASPGEGPDDATVLRQAKDRRAFRELPWYVQFSVYLNTMQRTGAKGTTNLDMSAWLASLPRSLDTPLHWSQDEVKELQYDFLAKAVAKQRLAWQGYHNSVVQNGFADLSWEDFVWGCEMARSRAFSGAYKGSAFNPAIYAFTLVLVAIYVGLGLGTIEQAANGAGVVFCATILKDFVFPKLLKTKKFVICPLIDMTNHQSIGYAGDVSFEYFGDGFSLATTQSLKAGSPVCISYGARSNDQWLQYYGFCETNNPHDVYILPSLREWPLAAMEQAAGRTVGPGRLQALERAGLLGYIADASSEGLHFQAFDESAANAEGGVVVTRAGGLDPAVWQALRALFCTDAEWQAAGQAVGSFAESSPSVSTEASVRSAAHCALQWELARQPTTLEQDVAVQQRQNASKAVDTSTAERLALAFRIEKKKILQECLRSIA